ncbi:TonB-linked SusC/RagA family outer membrane protein [Arcticibacter pallidicorallinus]|uniref:TonB-linked SusC/RagA family outer membrane protein n=1 Tax=Arcticibacter pallidicorallinus TaxID=1259464 RepID=A0A2T0U3T0_9SPHI|nr:TonB-dependent receptor [Arcticibacter pallidicorallinus]PRY52572.1 TonB-linked SusC/RagA family outer membrane protein [Arcticibacter pallidicorallinus]
MQTFKLTLTSWGRLCLAVSYLLIHVCYSSAGYAQTPGSSLISGKVTAEDGEELPGVSVKVKGTALSTVSDANGNFKISSSGNATLVFTYIGFITQEVPIQSRTSINVRLQTDSKALDEVIVVGYGTQRKVNLTGSVASVTGNTLTQRAAPNAASLLQGRVTGLQVTQNSSEPGRDNPSFLIRGRGSFSGGTANEPLVLIDGVTGSFGNLSPDDIESVTVLKDAASASIYGARAANGVILVTTKRGKKGQTVISYRGNVARHTPTALPDLITNSAEYMEMFNAAAIRQGLPASSQFAQAEIEKYRNATDRNLYPNFDNVDYYINPATVTNHSVSASGGSEKSTFNLSLGYLDQNAMIKGYKFKRYNGLLSYTNDISKVVTIGTSVNATYKDRNEPPFTGENITLAIYAAGPLYGPFLPDGSGRIASKAYAFEGRNRNPQEYYAMGNQSTKEYNLNGQAFIDVKPFKGLTWTTKVAMNYVDEYYKMYQKNYDAYLFQKESGNADYTRNTFGPDILGVTDQYSKVLNPTIYSTATYNTTIAKDHNVRFLAGYEQLFYKNQNLRGRRINTVAPALTDLTGYLPGQEQLYFSHPRLPSLQAPSEWAMRSFFGSANYNFKGKYLLEVNARYDGTSKVSPDYRWGFYPSVSGGWIVSEESFVKDRFSWLSNFKLRASYGILGNQDVGTYLYQDNLVINDIFYPFDNNTLQQGAVNNVFRDQSLRWESTKMLDLGLDLDIKNGLLGLTFDWFDKTTYDILAMQPIPASLGLTAPTLNDGRMRNRGIELGLTHQNRIGEVSYGVNGLISTARNQVLDIRIPAESGANIRRIGLPYDAHYLYVWDGIFQVEDIGNPNVPKHALNMNPKAGDLKMKDLNGDGVVDVNDRQVVDGYYPDFSYSFGFNVGYKGFQLNGFFQGVEGIKSRVNNWGIDPFMQGTAPTTKWRDAWTPENRSNELPGIYIAGYSGVASYGSSTYYLQDASYLRLKNIMLSYEVPVSFAKKVGAKNLGVYVSADNLFTITKYEGGDPERASPTGNYAQYPQAKIYNVGLNVKF